MSELLTQELQAAHDAVLGLFAERGRTELEHYRELSRRLAVKSAARKRLDEALASGR